MQNALEAEQSDEVIPALTAARLSQQVKRGALSFQTSVSRQLSGYPRFTRAASLPIVGHVFEGSAVPRNNAFAPGRRRAQPPVQLRRCLMLRLGTLWAVPLFWHASPAGAANSARDSELDWAADPEAARAVALLRSIGRAHWVQEGTGPRIVYIFFDPNCPYSHKLFLATRAEVDKAGLQLRWIPVAQLEFSSMGKAAAILQAPDRLAAFHKNETDWNFGDSPAGGIRPLAHPDAKVVRQLQANAALMHQAGLHTFPVMLYRSANGNAHLIIGLLPDGTLPTVLRSVV
ncbi:MAG: hypothetical protein WCA24_03350 [Thiomonas sp.]